MKLLNLYNRKVSISYRHSICSFAAVYVAVLTTFAIVVPFYVIFSINGDLWATQYQHKIVYEQPVINFQYQYILMSEHRAAGSQNKVGGIVIDDITDAYTPGGGNSVDSTTTAPDNTLLAWSSFDYFNQVMERWQQSVSIKVNFVIYAFSSCEESANSLHLMCCYFYFSSGKTTTITMGSSIA